MDIGPVFTLMSKKEVLTEIEQDRAGRANYCDGLDEVGGMEAARRPQVAQLHMPDLDRRVRIRQNIEDRSHRPQKILMGLFYKDEYWVHHQYPETKVQVGKVILSVFRPNITGNYYAK